jgi:hypothetical protein
MQGMQQQTCAIHCSYIARVKPIYQALMIVIGNPAVLMNDKHWLALLMSCSNHGAVTGQPMPDLSGAADAAASGGLAGAGVAGYAASSSTRDPTRSSLQQQIEQLEKLMTSITLSQAVDEVAAQQLLLEGPLGFSGLVDEAGGGMVRHE